MAVEKVRYTIWARPEWDTRWLKSAMVWPGGRGSNTVVSILIDAADTEDFEAWLRANEYVVAWTQNDVRG